MNRPVIRIIVSGSLIAASVLLQGCWGRNFWDAQDATLATESKVDSLLGENALLQRRIYHLETILEAQQEQLRRSDARTSLDLEEIKDELNALHVILDENRRVPAREVPVRHSTATSPAEADTISSPDSLPAGSGGAESPGDTSAVEESGPAGADVSVPAPQELHRQIYLDFSRMEYEIALEESEIFLAQYNGDPLTEDVRFIRGECYLELGEDLDALKEFSTILQDFPRGRKVPAVLLRMALTYERSGDSELAKGVAGRLMREYPNSEEAAEARERFGDLPDDQ